MKNRRCGNRAPHSPHEFRGKQAYYCGGRGAPRLTEAELESEIAAANGQAREWKSLFLRAIGVTDPWAITTWKLADAERELERRAVRS